MRALGRNVRRRRFEMRKAHKKTRKKKNLNTKDAKENKEAQ